MGISQGEAVYQAVVDVVGEISGEVKLDDKQKKEVYGKVFTMFKTGVTQHKGNPSDEDLLKYIPGLVNNWTRKDKRLNGGVAYAAKRPGSRTGTGDVSLKAMKDLLSITVDPEVRQQIQESIAERLGELKPKVTVNVEALPEHLRKYISQ